LTWSFLYTFAIGVSTDDQIAQFVGIVKHTGFLFPNLKERLSFLVGFCLLVIWILKFLPILVSLQIVQPY
jgi:hypothetical protein